MGKLIAMCMLLCTILGFSGESFAEKSSVHVDEMQLIIKKGHTLSWFSNRFGVSISQLQKLNKITDPDLIIKGRYIRIPLNTMAGKTLQTAAQSVAATAHRVTTVQPSVLSEVVQTSMGPGWVFVGMSPCVNCSGFDAIDALFPESSEEVRKELKFAVAAGNPEILRIDRGKLLQGLFLRGGEVFLAKSNAASEHVMTAWVTRDFLHCRAYSATVGGVAYTIMEDMISHNWIRSDESKTPT